MSGYMINPEAPKPGKVKAETRGLLGDNIGRHHVSIPIDVYNELMAIASDLDFGTNGRVCLVPMLEAISQVDPEDVEQFLRERGLMPKVKLERKPMSFFVHHAAKNGKRAE